MRLLAVFSLILFGLALFQLGHNLPGAFSHASHISLGDLDGFNAAVPDPRVIALGKEFSDKFEMFSGHERNFKLYGLLLSFLTTALTAACTLLSTIKAAKDNAEVSKKFVIMIAIISFVSSLTSWGNTQLTEERTAAQQRMQKVKETRVSFYADYEKLTDESKRDLLITSYHDKLQEI